MESVRVYLRSFTILLSWLAGFGQSANATYKAGEMRAVWQLIYGKTSYLLLTTQVFLRSVSRLSITNYQNNK